MFIHPTRRIGRAGACLLLILGAFAGPAGAAPALFKLSAPSAARAVAVADPAERAITARQSVEVDAALLAGTRAGDSLQLDLPGGLRVEGVVQDVHTNARGARVYAGTVRDRDEGKFLLVVRGDEIVGNVTLPPLGLYQLRRVASGEGRELRRVDSRLLLPCGANDPGASGYVSAPAKAPAFATTAASSQAQTDDGTQYDLMIVYTPAARAAAGGTQAIETLADLAVEDTNNVYANSQITIRARLVHTEEVAYTESGKVYTDVNRLRDTADGYLDNVHALRDQYKADLVSLWVRNASDYDGYGVYNYDAAHALVAYGGFTALVYSQASPNLLAHEIGHNFGCNHDHNNASGDTFYPYGFGNRFTGNDGVYYRTIMAYNPGEWVPYFSSPSVFYQGVATGVADQEDNVRAMNNSARSVANFRASSTAPSAGSVPFFQGSVSVGNGFFYLDFFGYYAPFQFPYIYHNELKYLYTFDAANSERGAYFYDFQGLGFLYTSPALYPYLYSFDQGAFLYYFKGSTNPRVFVNLNTQQFIYR